MVENGSISPSTFVPEGHAGRSRAVSSPKFLQASCINGKQERILLEKSYGRYINSENKNMGEET
jgi:hypothetical protein